MQEKQREGREGGKREVDWEEIIEEKEEEMGEEED